jgi:hypothetical protein
MNKIIVLVGLCILGIGLLVYFLKPEPNSQTPQQQADKSVTEQHKPMTSNDSHEQNAQAENNRSFEKPASGKAKKLSEEALRYYKTAYKDGWESIVRDFENGTIANSKMTDAEKKKLCELALYGTNVEQTKRLFAVNCKPLNNKISFMSINTQLKDANGQVDQAEIIAKLKFLQDENILQTHGAYKLGPYEEKFNLQSNAVSRGLEEVSDYLLSIGVGYSGNSENLINSNLSGRNPSVSLVNKLLKAGILPNAATYTLLEERKIAMKKPELYQLLQQIKP